MRDLGEGLHGFIQSVIRLAEGKSYVVLAQVPVLKGEEGRAWDGHYAVLQGEVPAQSPVTRHLGHSRSLFLQILLGHLQLATVSDEKETSLALQQKGINTSW